MVDKKSCPTSAERVARSPEDMFDCVISTACLIVLLVLLKLMRLQVKCARK